MDNSNELVLCEPFDVARWIGLGDASVLGAEPIRLTAAGVEKLREFGDRAELATKDAAAILRSYPSTVHKYTREGQTIRLGHRYGTSRVLLIPAADLAAFIVQKLKPPVPTSGRAPKPDIAASRRAVADAARRHNLPAA